MSSNFRYNVYLKIYQHTDAGFTLIWDYLTWNIKQKVQVYFKVDSRKELK